MTPGDNFAFLLPIMMATFGVAFLLVARHGGRGAIGWGTGYLAAGAAYGLPYLVSGLPLAAVALTADALFLVAFVAFAAALRARFGLAPRVKRDAVLSLAAFAVLAYVVAVRGDVLAELVVSDGSSALLLLGPCLAGSARARRRIDWAILAVSGLVIADNLTRTTLFASVGREGLDGFATSTYAFAMQASGAVFGLFFALVGLAAVAGDVIEKHRDAAERDPLSGLLNRRGFENRAPQKRPGEAMRGAVAICDIDHFKRVNDAFGHAAGDRVIAAFAEVLRRNLPDGGCAARFGGEEFVICLSEGSLAEASLLAERVRLEVSLLDLAPVGVPTRLTASFGVAAVERDDHSLHDAIARADARLYAAKLAGRNRVVSEDGAAGAHPRLPRVA